MAKKERFTVEQMEEALRKAGGSPTHAAAVLESGTGKSITGEAVRYYMKKYPKLRKLRDELHEELGDLVESKLMQAVRNDNMQVCMFLARTKFKDRGYIERQENTGKDGEAMEHKVTPDLSKLTKEERDALRPVAERLAQESEANASGA